MGPIEEVDRPQPDEGRGGLPLSPKWASLLCERGGTVSFGERPGALEQMEDSLTTGRIVVVY